MQATNQQFKQSFSGSVGSGLGAVFNSSGRRFYILEHKVSSQYHKAGESQRIIIDEVMIGRDPKCQVRFDESFGTVSREHAAIRKEGDNYVLIQMSKTNTTYLNGIPVKDRWYLQNGDEIQLSTNGPKLGFIIPPGEQSMVKSIGLSARLSLFRKQALAPYKKAMTVLSILLVFAIAGGVGYGFHSHNKLKDLVAVLDTYKNRTNEALQKNSELNKEIARLDSISKVRPKYSGGGGSRPTGDIATMLEDVKGSVCYLETIVYVEYDGEKKAVGACGGTAFLLNDGTLLTARHCVEPWLYSISDENMRMVNALATAGVGKVYSVIKAYYGDNVIKFTSYDFNQDKSQDIVVEWDDDIDITLPMPLINRNGELMVGNKSMFGTDWASAHTNQTGNIIADYAGSSTLKAGEKLYVLGFPMGLGVDDGNRKIEPIFNELSVARDGLNDSGCIMITSGVDHGNSGGPVFANRNGKLVAVGIVSRGDYQSEQYNHLVPVKNVKR
ncbi:MAG: FHA domain-containing protein [Bacteroidales bacterium]|nr:FHA domain-containing protein [Bacteroidales bacterium]